MSLKTGYLGPEGSYSQIAARLLAQGEYLPYPSFYALVGALQENSVDGIVLPVENSLNGGVMQNLDLLQDAEGITAVREVNVKIDHRLVTLKGADLDGITAVYSHAQALGQCAKFLHANLPQAKLIPTQSTSACLKKIKTFADAGIIGAQEVDERFALSPECISDEPLNYTQFLYVVKGSPDMSRHTQKMFLSITCAHKPGSLMAALSVFADGGMNLTKIESRPIKDRVGEYRFFIEAEADCALPHTRSALNSLGNICSSVKILGCY